ncbi:MAG: ShlB/FhaC/HecB family hemolysin secretion/activation protein [Burkholderiales bacterium]
MFAISGFSITGDNPLSDSETTLTLAPFLRSDANIDTLQKATAALEKALRDKGFGLHRVSLPPQEVGDKVALVIVKFVIGKVNIEGANRYDSANILRSVPELREGATPNFNRLAVQTTIANESQGKQIQVTMKESEEADKIDATVSVNESKPWNFSVSIANNGSESSGKDRTTLSGSHSNLFNLDHQFVGAYTTSLQRASDVKQVGLSYRIPLYSLGGVIGASYSRSDVVGNFGAFTSTGAGRTLGANYTFYLPPQGGKRTFFSIGLDDKLFNTALINNIAIPGQADRRSRPISLGYSVRSESDAENLSYNAELAFNTGSGSGNDLASYQSEDPRISTVRWKLLRAGFNYATNLPAKFLLALRGQLQYSPDTLISGEQFGIGGSSSVRGTDERPLSADKGLFASVEITSPEFLVGVRGLGFFDAGWISNNNPNGVSRPSSDRLRSLGLGLRYNVGNFALSADYGRLLNSSAVPLSINSNAPQKGDDKLNLSLSVRF